LKPILGFTLIFSKFICVMLTIHIGDLINP
jgi:hypothetical protein